MNQQLKEKQIQKKKVQEEKEDGLEVLARGITLYKLIGLDFEQIQGISLLLVMSHILYYLNHC